MLIAPRNNHLIQQSAELYASFLIEPAEGQTPFVNIHLEQVIEAYASAGELAFASALHDRYSDWYKVDEAVRAALRARGKEWMLAPPRNPAPLALIAKAA